MKKVCLLLFLSFYHFLTFAQNPLLLGNATNDGTATVSQIVTVGGGHAFYNVTDNSNSYDGTWGLWTTDGTIAGTKKITLQDAHYISVEATQLTFLDSSRILFAGDNTQGYYGEVWVSDGTQAGTFGLQNSQPNGYSSSTAIQAIGTISGLGIYAAVAYNSSIVQLHSTHGLAYGDTAVFFTFPSSIASVQNFKTINGILYFEANNTVTHDNEIWRTDGSTGGTYLLKDLAANGLTSDFMAFNGNIYFITISSTLGDYIWKSDGTPGGTAPLKQLATSFQPDNVYPSYAATSSALYFAAADGVHGKEVWSTDGTSTGTHLTADLFAGSNGSNPSSFVTLQDVLYLSATNGFTGQELYTYTGSSFSLVKDIYPGAAGSNPSSLAVNGNSIVFSAKANETEGTELWVSGGTAATTFEIANVAKGTSLSSFPSLITPGAEQFFAGSYDINGDGLANEKCVFLYTPPTKIWTGNVSSDATVADNWFPAGAPANGDDIIIPASATPNSLTNPVLLPHHFYNNGGTVNDNGGIILIGGDFYNEGTVNADVNTSVFALVSATSDRVLHQVGSPGAFNGKLILSSLSNARLTAGLKVIELRTEGVDSVFLGDNNLTADYLYLYTPKIVTDGAGKLFLSVSNQNVLFPVCSKTLSYTPATISNSGVTDYFGVSVQDSVLSNGYDGDTLTHSVVNKTWDIAEQTPGGSNANITLQWQASDVLGPFDTSRIYVAHYTGSAWDSGALTQAFSIPPAYFATRSGVTSFSPFAVFSSPSALPVSFTAVAARLSGQDVAVSWQASGDENVRWYNVQRSTDGRTFTTLAQQARTGSGGYRYTDANAALLPAAKTLYYRLQSVDVNGRTTLSGVMPVTLSAAPSFRVWPSPAADVLHLVQGNEMAQGKGMIYNAAGKPVISFTISSQATTDVNVASLAAGAYFIKVYTATGTLSDRFIKK